VWLYKCNMYWLLLISIIEKNDKSKYQLSLYQSVIRLVRKFVL